MPRAVRRTKKIHNTTPTKTSASDTVHGSPGIPTTTGLLGLPVELFEMVLSEYQDISTDTILSNPTSLPKESGERTKVLRVLSQTCRALRTSCLPRAWERLEACIEHTDGVWYKQVSGNLERKCNGLTATPEIAKLVKVATVALTRCSTCTVLTAFANCLAILPNLHTLQVVHAHSQMTSALKGHFEGKSFPQIRTIVLPSCAHNILRSCPEVRNVTCNGGDGSTLVSAMRASCKKVESVSGFRLEKSIMNRLVKAVPHLREMHVDVCDLRLLWNSNQITNPDELRLISNFKKLQILHLVIDHDGQQVQQVPTTKLHITAALDALKGSSAQDKELVILYSQCYFPMSYWSGTRVWETIRTVRMKV